MSNWKTKKLSLENVKNKFYSEIGNYFRTLTWPNQSALICPLIGWLNIIIQSQLHMYDPARHIITLKVSFTHFDVHPHTFTQDQLPYLSITVIFHPLYHSPTIISTHKFFTYYIYSSTILLAQHTYSPIIIVHPI